MTDSEFIESIQNASNKELFEQLDLYGCDPYYRELWRAVLNELKRRLQEPKTGHWIDDEFGGCECSECGCLEGGYSDYCPNCGAKMVEPQESEEISEHNIKMWEEIFKAESEDKE